MLSWNARANFCLCEVSLISPDYLIYVIVILEDTPVVSMCYLTPSGSPVPITELYLPELLSSEIPVIKFCRTSWALGTAGFCSAECQSYSWAGGPSSAPACTWTAWQSFGVKDRLSIICCPARRDCCAEAETKFWSWSQGGGAGGGGGSPSKAC